MDDELKKQDLFRLTHGLFGFNSDICDVWIRILGADFFFWKAAECDFRFGEEQRNRFAWGTDCGDGIFAIKTPWFMIYPIPDFIYKLWDKIHQ